MCAYPVIKYSKRKRAQTIFFALSGGGSLLYMMVDNVMGHYLLVFMIKFGTASSFCVIYVLTTELYPTEIRGLAFGISNTFARLATLLATIVAEFDPSIYLTINFFLSISVIALSLMITETKGLELKDKISQ